MNVPNELGQRLKSCAQKGQASVNAGSTKDLRTSIEQLLEEYDDLQDERKEEIGEDEVGDFINALADKRATLAMVTSKVREWLEDHDALDRLGVTTR
jgi:RNA processing factor Prp31